MAKRHIHIGTSGWNYNHWRECFYPKKLRQADWLAFYCRHFDTVEVNNTFYKLPTEKALESWKSNSPENFCFAIKASKFITHMKKLKDGEETIHNFMETIEPLDGKLGPILFQLPPKWRLDIGRLKSFIEALPNNRHYIFEFRDPTWWDQQVYDLLREHNIGFCIYNMHDKSSPREMTSNTVYIRLHGAR